MTWQTHRCGCGYLATRSDQQPCGRCGAPLGPESKRPRQARELQVAGWQRITLDLWRRPDWRPLKEEIIEELIDALDESAPRSAPQPIYSLAAAYLTMQQEEVGHHGSACCGSGCSRCRRGKA